MITALAAIGFTSIIAQLLVLWELVSVFNGNELTYGLSLMIWLLASGLGSYVAGRIFTRLADPFKSLISIELALSVIIPAELLFARLSKVLFSIPAGAIDPGLILLISIISIAPASFLFAALFYIGSKMLKNIVKMYIIESIGAVSGGVLFFLLVNVLDPFRIAGVAGTALAASALYIYKHFGRTGKYNKVNNLILLSAVLTVNLVLIHPVGHRIDQHFAKAQFVGAHLLSVPVFGIVGPLVISLTLILLSLLLITPLPGKRYQ